MKSLSFLLILGCLGIARPQDSEYLPVVLWHGMGDSCCNPFSMGHIKRIIQERLPGVYVYSVMVGNNVIADMENTFFSNSNDQVTAICGKIKNDTNLQNGYNAVGFSQGGQFLRAIAQRCPDPPMNNLITLGAQHQGVFGLPSCPPDDLICEEIRRLLNMGAYIPAIQNGLVQAQYWHDPLHEDVYRNNSIFIAEINNELVINEMYKENLMKLNNFVMGRFLDDDVVIPQESEWFGFYAPGQDVEVLPMNQTHLYLEDRLGLQRMDQEGKIKFLATSGNHMAIGDQWFIDEIVDVYLA